jgi:hypothetical protein
MGVDIPYIILIRDRYPLHNINVNRNIVGPQETFILLGMWGDCYSWLLTFYVKSHRNKQTKPCGPI